MRIKRLELVGFKSFVNPTVIDFESPIVGIVGPNGCGKSNVVDAIRWVMGEMSPKSLRGKSMEDVIFNGSESRPPTGMAEVSLTFSTEDGITPVNYANFTEITITRRLYRSGESEYLINKVQARLHDVIDLFLGTGVGHRAYSIIEQGKIDFVINSKPEDRRLLLEEAAGVSKFKSRKEAALRKMEGTEQNLARLRDILNEVTRQINSLDRQVKKAEKYKILKDELRQLELNLSALTHKESSSEILELRELLQSWNERETTSAGLLSSLETDLEKERLEATEQDRLLNELQEKNFEVVSRLQLLEAQEGFWKKETDSLKEQQELNVREIEDMKSRLQVLLLEITEQEKKKLAFETESGDSDQRLLTLEQQGQEAEMFRERVQKSVESMKQVLQQKQTETAHLDSEKRLYDDRKVSLRGQIAKIEVERADVKKRSLEQKNVFENHKALFQESCEKHNALKTDLENLKIQFLESQERKEILTQELNLRREELVMKRSRLKSLQDLERNFEGYEEGVRSILNAKKEHGQGEGVFGVVAQLIETQPQYEMAVSAALGEKLQYVIVNSHEEGVDAINYLKTQGSGRSSFIPLQVRESKGSDFFYDQEGVMGPLLDQVKIRQGYQQVAQYLLGDMVLVDSLQRALSLWGSNGHKKTLVTLDGEVVDPSGVVTGGAASIRGKLLLEKKREIQQLLNLVGELEEEIGLKEDTLSQVECSLSELSVSLENKSALSRDEELKLTSLEREVEHASEELQRIEREALKFNDSFSQLHKELSQADLFFMDFENKRAMVLVNVSEREKELAFREEDLRQAHSQARQLHDKLTALRIEAAAFAERKAIIGEELERLTLSQTEITERIQQKMVFMTEANQKIVELQSSIEGSSSEKLTLKGLAEELTVKQEEARSRYEELTSHLQEKETKIREVRKESDLCKSHTGDLRVTLSRVESDLHHLEQQILEKYSVNLSEFVTNQPPAPEPGMNEPLVFDRAYEEKHLAEMKEKLERMGDVNLGSIPEYEELKTRQEFLSRQVADLEGSMEALKKAIHKINQTTKKRFEETYNKVNERFQSLFPRLFQGGRAELRLVATEQGEDILNAGVELLAQPGGKKLSHISLLSGGEKALSAMAFVFSIFLVKPSPFCILDEVDAPLDDANVDRFHHLLSEMAPRTQFILITHNRRTMERSDMLYGVTMMEPGVSQLVSVRLADGLKLAS